MIKLLHIADVHLDRPFKSRQGNVVQSLRKAMRTALQRAASFCIEREVDALLIAGDLFDGETVEPGTALFLKSELDRLNHHGIKVIYSTGNHDCAQRIRNLAFFNWPENVHMATASKHSVFKLQGRDGTPFVVVACGHESAVEVVNAVKAFPNKLSLYEQNQGGHLQTLPVVGMAHSWLTNQTEDGKERYMPCTLDEIKSLDYDYFALGHIHARTTFLEGKVGYSGSLQAIDRDETGLRGGHYIEIEQGATTTTFVPFSGLVFLDVDVEIDAASNLEDVGELVMKGIDKQVETLGIGCDEALYKVNLLGRSGIKALLKKENAIQALEERVIGRTGTLEVQFDSSRIQSVVAATDFVETDTLLGFMLKTLGTPQKLEEIVTELMMDLNLTTHFANEEDARTWVFECLSASGDDLTQRMVRCEEDLKL